MAGFPFLTVSTCPTVTQLILLRQGDQLKELFGDVIQKEILARMNGKDAGVVVYTQEALTAMGWMQPPVPRHAV